MTALGAPLGAALDGLLRGQAPADLEGLAQVYGSNRAMANELTGMQRSPMRNIQRYRKTGGQRRGVHGPPAAVLAQLRAGAVRILSARNVARAREHGIEMQLRAIIRVSQKVFPAGMPYNRFQLIPGPRLATTLRLWQQGDSDGAGEALLTAFYTAYWPGPEDEDEDGPAETVEITSVQLRWPG